MQNGSEAQLEELRPILKIGGQDFIRYVRGFLDSRILEKEDLEQNHQG